MSTMICQLAHEMADGSLIQHRKTKKVYILLESQRQWYDLEAKLSAFNDVDQCEDVNNFTVIREGFGLAAEVEPEVGDVVETVLGQENQKIVPLEVRYAFVTHKYLDSNGAAFAYEIAWPGPKNDYGSMAERVNHVFVKRPDDIEKARNTLVALFDNTIN